MPEREETRDAATKQGTINSAGQPKIVQNVGEPDAYTREDFQRDLNTPWEAEPNV